MDNQSDSIISLLYEASLDPAAWSGALDLLVSSLHAVGASYFVWDPDHQCANFWCAVGHDEAMQQRYLSHYSMLDPTRDAVMDGKVGEIVFSRLLFPQSYIQRSEYFQDYLLPAGIGNVLGGKIMQVDSAIGLFSVQQSADLRDLERSQEALIRRILPHLVRASKIHWRMSSLHKHALTLQIALQTITLPVFIVDGTRRVHFLNAAADQLMKTGMGLVMQAKGLSCSSANSHRSLSQVITKATCAGQRESGGVRIWHGAESNFLTVVPIPLEQSTGVHPDRLALVIASSCVPSTETFLRLISGLFHLTLAEKRLAGQLLDGHTLAEAADELHLGRETVRSQLRTLFEKTDTHRQAQLVALLQKLAFIAPPNRPN